MKILGVIGSARKLGNCEVLVKEALLKAKDMGTEIRVIRLPDFNLLPCKGCLACVLKGEPCRLDDDMHALWDHLQWADGIILSAPTYFLGPAGIIKLLIDRLFEYSLQLGGIKRRPAGIIATAGLPEWDPFTIPMLTMLAGILRLDILDKYTAYRPGPGEVLLDEETMARAATIGQRIVQEIQEPQNSLQKYTEANICPQCGTPFFQITEHNKIECLLCQTQGLAQSKGKKITITWFETGGKNRWSTEALAEHFSEWVLKTGPVYQKYREKIQKLKQKYQEIPIESLRSRK